MSLLRVGHAEPIGNLEAPLPEEAQTQCAGLVHALMRPSQAVRVLAMVSSGAGEGTSTSVINVARYLARVRAVRTLVIDANVYAPALHTLAGVASSPGLAEVLRGDVAFTDAVRSTVVPNLSVLTAGDLAQSAPGTMLSLEALRAPGAKPDRRLRVRARRLSARQRLRRGGYGRRALRRGDTCHRGRAHSPTCCARREATLGAGGSAASSASS